MATPGDSDLSSGEKISTNLPHNHPIEFSPGSTTFTFVNAHLAAFDDMVEKRHSDFQDLSRRLTFAGSAQRAGIGATDNVDKDPLEVEPDTETESTILSVYDTDALFWLVRLTLSLPFRRLACPSSWDFGS